MRVCGGAAVPSSAQMAGVMKRSKITMAETGLPGRPKIALPSHTARIVGLPGLTLTPCTSTPGRPSSPMTSAVMSR